MQRVSRLCLSSGVGFQNVSMVPVFLSLMKISLSCRWRQNHKVSVVDPHETVLVSHIQTTRCHCDVSLSAVFFYKGVDREGGGGVRGGGADTLIEDETC